LRLCVLPDLGTPSKVGTRRGNQMPSAAIDQWGSELVGRQGTSRNGFALDACKCQSSLFTLLNGCTAPGGPVSIMPRKLRLEYPGAIYHFMSLGEARISG
jgi:hypothetical protein